MSLFKNTYIDLTSDFPKEISSIGVHKCNIESIDNRGEGTVIIGISYEGDDTIAFMEWLDSRVGMGWEFNLTLHVCEYTFIIRDDTVMSMSKDSNNNKAILIVDTQFNQ